MTVSDLHLGHRLVSELRGFVPTEQHDEAFGCGDSAQECERESGGDRLTSGVTGGVGGDGGKGSAIKVVN